MATVKVGGITLPKYDCPKELQHLVPAAEAYEPSGYELSAIALAIKNRRPLGLFGHAGVGKNAVIRHVAHLLNRPLLLLSLAEGTTIDQLIGVPMPKGLPDGGFTVEWRDGMLPLAIKIGAFLVLDEVNASDERTMMRLHDCFANDFNLYMPENPDGNGHPVSPWDDKGNYNGFSVFLTANPHDTGQYAGTRELNSAFLDRLYTTEMTYLGLVDAAKEAAVVAKAAKVKVGKARRIVDVMNDIRRRAMLTQRELDEMSVTPMYVVASVRRSVDIAELSKDLPIMRAVELGFTNRINADDQAVVHKMFLDAFANED